MAKRPARKHVPSARKAAAAGKPAQKAPRTIAKKTRSAVAKTARPAVAKKARPAVAKKAAPGIKKAMARGGPRAFEDAAAAAPTPAAGADDASVRGFSEFLGDIAEAMIGAQRKLDAQTDAYLNSTSIARPLPTMFRLPKLKATMKCAVKRTEEEGLNLLFYRDVAQASVQHQQTIDFELVAVPPPPEAGLVPGRFFSLMPRIDLVLDAADRRALLELLGRDAAGNAALDLGAAPADAADDVAIWELLLPVAPDGGPVAERLLLAARATEAAPGTRLCLVGVRSAGGASIVRVQPLDAGPLADELGEFLEALGERQRRLLGSRRTA